MWRFIKVIIFAGLTALAAATGGAAVARMAPAGTGDVVAATAAGVGGLVFGLIYAWVRGFPWQRIREHVKMWRVGLAKQFWWAVTGCVSVAVLVFY